MALRGDGKADGPVCECQCAEHCLGGDAVELDTALQAIANVEDSVRVTWAELSKAGRQHLI